jgi:hypothetical protein
MGIGSKIASIIVLTTAVISLLGILVTPVAAQTFPINIGALIQRLLSQAGVLKGVSTVVPKISTEAPSSVESINSVSFYNYTQDLSLGSKGDDVVALQQMLISGGYLKISEPTAYFGSVTETALMAWQKANSINPSGYFGPLSQAKIAGLTGISAGAAGTASTSVTEDDNSVVNNDQSPATFIKTFHIWDATEGYGVVPLKNGGYLLTGDIISGAGVFYPFIIKTDPKGNIVWSERFGSSSNVYSISSSRHIGRVAVETVDGSIVMVSDTTDFISAEYEKVRESYGDVLITKLSFRGTKLWSIMLGDYSTDQPQKLWALPDGGVMLLARFSPTGYGNDVADPSALSKYSVLVKIDKNGQVIMSKKMGWNAIDMVSLADGSFIVLSNIAIPQAEESQIMDTKTSTAPLPTILKLNSALNVEWAKTMEMIPSELSFPISIVNGKVTTIGVTKVRMPGGDFKAIQPTPDGGFIAFGYAGLLNEGMSGISMGGQQLLQYIDLHPFIAVKVDATGKYLWARKLTGSLFRGSTAIDFQVARTTDNSFVILQEVVRDKNWQTHEGNREALAQARAINIELIKTDANFNARWVKKFDVEKDLFGYDIQPTVDGGVAVTGIISTNKTHMVIGSAESYGEAILIKTDVNGEVSGCADVSDHPEATVEDQSQYLVMQDMTVAGAKDAVLNVNKKVNEKISAVGDTARNICEYQKNNVAPISSYLNSNIFTSQPGTSVTPPVARTWMQINFENAKEAEIESEKNRQIHEELLPILNQIFSNQVKITDSANSGWMTYCFPRLTTRADVEAVQKYYEGLGYKIDESESGTLNVSKIGLSLRMTFYISNLMKGKLDVMF